MDENRELPQVSFRGHIEECLGHLAKLLTSKIPKGSKGSAKAKEPIAKFCNSTVKSVQDWLNGTVPKGEQLIKLMCWLSLMGYKVIEMQRLSNARRGMVELIGFNLLSRDQATEVLGYENFSLLSRVLCGRSGASHGKDQRMWELLQERKEELQQRKEEARKQYGIEFIQQPMVVGNPVSLQFSESLARRHQAIISTVDTLLALLDKSSIGEFSESEAVRQPEVQQKILHLSALIGELSYRMSMPQRRETGHGA